MYRRFSSLLLGVLLGLVAASAQAQTLKIATVVPDGSAWMREMRQAGAEIKERTEGRVKLKFYPGGIMGDDATVLRKMRVGQLQGGAFTSGGLRGLYPDIDIYSLPLTFRSYAEVDYVRARMDERIRKGLEESGLVVLAISDGGYAHLLSQKPIRNAEDLKGTRLWVLENDVTSRTALEIAGVSPVPLSIADVYTGLQTGLVDAVAAPPMAAIAFQWHTKVKYFTDVPLMYLIGVVAVDRKAFAKIRADDRAVVREVIAAAARQLDTKGRIDDARAREALFNQGIESVTASSPEELERWHRIADQAQGKLRSQGVYSNEVVDALHSHLEEFRAQPPADAE